VPVLAPAPTASPAIAPIGFLFGVVAAGLFLRPGRPAALAVCVTSRTAHGTDGPFEKRREPVRFSPPLGDLTVSGDTALWALDQYRSVTVPVTLGPSERPVATTFCRAGRRDAGTPRVLFLHGADSNALEWRHVMRSLEKDYDCCALDWWSGGFTEREQITTMLQKQDQPQPWLPVREHIRAFWEQEIAEPVILVGTSLGGAVALDFAAAHPEAVRALVLVDAGGQSYKAPDPDTVSALAPVALQVKRLAAFVQQRIPSEDVRLVALHRSEPYWKAALGEYLRSGSYQRVVGPELIRTVPQRTLVVWGEDDDILPLADAHAFDRDLQDCAGVKVIAGSGHSPHLDNPAAVVGPLKSFLEQIEKS